MNSATSPMTLWSLFDFYIMVDWSGAARRRGQRSDTMRDSPSRVADRGTRSLNSNGVTDALMRKPTVGADDCCACGFTGLSF